MDSLPIRHLTMLSLPAIIGAACVLAYAGLIFYRLVFHPLARFPGPRLAAATGWYEAYFELFHKGGARYCKKIRQLHDRYGPIVRINPDEVSVRDAAFHDKLYSPPRSEIRHRHAHFSTTLGTTMGSFSTVDHHLHKSRKAAYLPFWGTANVAAAEPLIMDMVNALCERVAVMNEKNFNLRTLFAAISFDTFYTWAFGHSLGLLDNLQLAYESNLAVDTLVTTPPVFRTFPWLMSVGKLIPRRIVNGMSPHLANVLSFNTIITKAARDWVATHGHQTSEKEQAASIGPAKSRTLFAVLNKANIPPEEKEATRMAQEGVEMFMASYTPGRTMMFGMYYLLAHPDVLEKMRSELAEVNPDPSVDLTFAKLNALPYTGAIMKEILRLTFPVGTRLPMVCNDDIAFEDWIIPAKTGISVNHRDLLFDQEAFPEPLAFKPERWLDESNPIDEKRYNVPFGKGARGCPSKKFATQFIQLSLSTLVQRFDFELYDTVWERDIAVDTEATLTAPSPASQGVKIRLAGPRTISA